MQIGRLEIGIWTMTRPLTLKDWFIFEYDAGLCGCHIFTISKIYVIWMGDECYFNPPENEES